MFDAYFAPPFLQPIDAEHMASFGVKECVLAVASAHCDALGEHEAVPRAACANHPYASPRVRQAHARAVLESAGIRVFVADAISPHQEPERSWEAQWRSLTSRLYTGEVSVLGVFVLADDSPRAFQILDRHLVLSERLDVPVIVKMPYGLSARGVLKLQRRAMLHADRWYWLHPALALAHDALRRGQGVILSTSAQVSAHDLVAFASVLPSAQRVRLAIGSTRGRGLNPFALASVEIAADSHHPALEHPTLLRGGGFGAGLRHAASRPLQLPAQGVAL